MDSWQGVGLGRDNIQRRKRALTSGLHSSAKPGGGGSTLSEKR
jgi:hypothetical protein